MLIEMLFKATLIGADWVLYILIAFSLISIAIMAERTLLYLFTRVNRAALATDLKRTLDRDDLEGAKKLLAGSKAPEARICLSGLEEVAHGLGAVEENIVAASNMEKARMEKNLAFLGTVGSNAPFLGLFGTVLGIIKAFNELSMGQQEGSAAVMSGISEALVTTALGLLVAIPAVMAFNYFKRVVQARMNHADTMSRSIFAYLKRDRSNAAQA